MTYTIDSEVDEVIVCTFIYVMLFAPARVRQ